MGTDTKIQWTDHTWNPWRGCSKVSAGCDHCYAESMSGRNHAVLGEWGKDGIRAIAAESYWRHPFQWDAAAKAAGERRRVFCASLADVFEGIDTMPEESRVPVFEARLRLFDTIRRTPNLDWLLLTKRPENVMGMLVDSASWISDCHSIRKDIAGMNHVNAGFSQMWLQQWADGTPPPNVWIGTSVENQDAANTRIPHLLKIPAVVRFLSCEPMLGAIDLNRVGRLFPCDGLHDWPIDFGVFLHRPISLVICGGESGHGARPMHPDWARSLRDQCAAAGVSYFFKQHGEWEPYTASYCGGWEDTKGMWHDGTALQILNPNTSEPNPGWYVDPERSDVIWRKVGKKAAGRLLDGRTWDEFPEVSR